MPTGSGKTVTFLTLARDFGGPALVVVHRDELVGQTLRTAARVWPGAAAGVVQGPRDEWRGRDLVVASVQSLHRKRLHSMPPDLFSLLVVDEAHHAAAPTYGAVMGHFSARFCLGVTATPRRLDGQGLAEWFGEKPLFTYPIRQAIQDGVLVPVSQFAIKTGVSLDGVKTRGGDFAENQLALVVNTAIRNAAVVDAYLQHTADRRAIVFAVNLEHVAALVEAFRQAGVAAASVTGQDPLDLRRRALSAFAAGQFSVLVNCLIATEGFDDPAVDAILMARPTQSQALYVQCVGRGLRRCDATGKRDCLVLDITDNCKRHKLVTAASLLGEEREPVASKTDGEGEEKPKARRPEYTDQPVAWHLEEVAPWPELPDLNGYYPSKFWHFDRVTPKQLQCLQRFGLEVTRQLTKGEAAFLLDKCFKLDAEYPEPATVRQELFLRSRRCWRPGLTKKQASKLIAELKGGVACSA
jgi:superfamily II DNA or RNA helicase